MQLTKSMIRNLATDDKVFMRGMQYYQSGRIVNASYSKLSKRYKITVKGSYNYTVNVDEHDDDSFDYSCNCPSATKEKGACKHVVAALLMLLKRQERMQGILPKNSEEKRAYQVLEYFDNQENMSMTGDVFRIEPLISLPDLLRNDTGKAYVSLKVGNSRMYKVQNIKKFLEDYIRRENIV
ncbi:MAG: SWIM zinc finger family protein, partial [Lachnospiraceae bacterium]|nr:SWIM zinc finger family protein [Lachnospiraceae bacterium]